MERKIRICSIASGSNGNAYYIECDGEAILVDAGIGIRAFLSRTKERGIDYKRIHSIFITHEHSDHVRGLHGISRATGADSYMTAGTARKTKPYYMPKSEVKKIDANSVTEVGAFRVHSFSKPHDVEEPCSFRIEVGDVNIGVFTDIGCPCQGLIENLRLCNVVFLESNYDEKMLWDGEYPRVLKERIASDYGHLSNEQAARILAETCPERLHTVFLSHLSAENNHPRTALKAFDSLKEQYKIYTTSRYEAGELIEVTQSECVFPKKEIVIPERLDRAPLRF